MGNFITHLTRKKGMNIFIVNIISVYDDVCVSLFHIIIFLSLMRQKDDILHKKTVAPLTGLVLKSSTPDFPSKGYWLLISYFSVIIKKMITKLSLSEP